MIIIPPLSKWKDLSAKLIQSDTQLALINKNWGKSGNRRINWKYQKGIDRKKKHQANVVNNDVEVLELIQKMIPTFTHMKGKIPYTNLKSAIWIERQVIKIRLFFFFQPFKNPNQNKSKQPELYRKGLAADYFISSVNAVN